MKEQDYLTVKAFASLDNARALLLSAYCGEDYIDSEIQRLQRDILILTNIMKRKINFGKASSGPE